MYAFDDFSTSDAEPAPLAEPRRSRLRPIALASAVVFAALCFSQLSVTQHVFYLTGTYIDQGIQAERHRAMFAGHAGNPWQYRILAPYLIQPLIEAATKLGVPHPFGVSFVTFRILQDFAIYVMAYIYYRRMGHSVAQAFMGMTLLGWCMSYAFYDSDLQFNTYFDVLFFVLAALCALGESPAWIVPLTAVAAFNRETSGLMPFVFLAAAVAKNPMAPRRRLFALTAASFVIYLAVFVGLRVHYGPQELVGAYGHRAGLDMFRFNVGRFITWNRLFATYTIVPFIALMGRSRWPAALKAMFWVLVPVWLLIHAFAGVLAETRLLLVPFALVIVPAALLAMRSGDAAPRRRADVIGVIG